MVMVAHGERAGTPSMPCRAMPCPQRWGLRWQQQQGRRRRVAELAGWKGGVSEGRVGVWHVACAGTGAGGRAAGVSGRLGGRVPPCSRSLADPKLGSSPNVRAFPLWAAP